METKACCNIDRGYCGAAAQKLGSCLYRFAFPAPFSYLREKDFDPMAMTAQEIERFIKESLPDATVTISDLAGDGNHYSANVISASFKGKNRVQQHQMVYAALKGRMGGELHALALQTSVPE
jgi:stress-induced morphogen